MSLLKTGCYYKQCIYTYKYILFKIRPANNFSLHLALVPSRLLTTGPATGSPYETRGSNSSYNSPELNSIQHVPTKRRFLRHSAKDPTLKHVFKSTAWGCELDLSGSGLGKWWACVYTIMNFRVSWRGRLLHYLCINQLLNSPCFKLNVMHPIVFVFQQEVKPFPPQTF
jgi:hypothetical protein